MLSKVELVSINPNQVICYVIYRLQTKLIENSYFYDSLIQNSFVQKYKFGLFSI